MRKAIVRESDGLVINVIELATGWQSKKPKWQAPEGTYLVAAKTDGSPGDTWNGEVFIRPEVIPAPKPRNILAEIDDIKAKLDKAGI